MWMENCSWTLLSTITDKAEASFEKPIKDNFDDWQLHWIETGALSSSLMLTLSTISLAMIRNAYGLSREHGRIKNAHAEATLLPSRTEER